MKQFLINYHKQLSVVAVIVFLLMVIAGCAGGAQKVKPHQNVMGDTYCTYTITKVIGEGALKVGDTVCIYCPPPATSRCASTKTIEVAPGMEYDLVNLGNTCVECPTANTYE